jgi:regulator of sigma E protease
METFLIKAAQLILAFTILVSIHEFGHYLFARIFGMRVDRFYLFFNPYFSLLKYDPRKNTLQIIGWTTKNKEKKDNKEIETETPHALFTIKLGKEHPNTDKAKSTWRDTLYGLGWLPLGGYCSIAGMIDETTDKDQLSAEPEPWEFRAKKPWPRLMVMVAGVLFNFLLAIIIYIGIAMHWGERVVPFDAATEGMDYAEQLHTIGLKDGDMMLALNGKPADATDNSFMWNMIQDGARLTVLRNGTDTINVTVPTGFTQKMVAADQDAPVMSYRVPVVVFKAVTGENAAAAGIEAGDRIVSVDGTATPALTEFYPALNAHKGQTVPMQIVRNGKTINVNCAISDVGKIGIQLTSPTDLFRIEEVRYNFFTAIPKGIQLGTDRLVTYVSSLKLLFTKEGAQSIGGFGAIGDMYPDQWNWYSFWNITAFLSVILAFMNILPIPALDGGHVVFTLWEIITRRKPSLKVLEYAQMIGMGLLFFLLIYANANDIYRFFFK